jgi:flavin-dependent dehydrogenase
MSARSCRVLIAGAGPAGLATALYLLRRHPELAGEVVALEKSRHPRPKVCAGGLVPKTILAMGELGLDLGVPAVEVLRGVARTEVGDIEVGGREVLCTIVRRDQFDARLADAARRAGLEIVEDSRVLGVKNGADQVRVISERGAFEAPVVVGADGSGSRIAASVFGPRKQSIGRALMVDIPVDSDRTVEFSDRAYRFDFNCVRSGIKGYCWSFPCLIDSRPHLNVGIYDQCPRLAVEPGGDKAPLLDQLQAAFPDLALNGGGAGMAPAQPRFRAFPIRWYEARDRFASGRVILAGDAAGCDPLMGEGISCAFAHGKLAAEAVAQFLAGRHDALEHYDRTLHRGAIGRKLRKLAFASRRFYGPRHRLFFRLAALSRRAQEIGIDWYNGARHTDEIPTSRLVTTWLRSVLFAGALR